MEEANHLVAELQQKLSDLDRKVFRYQQDMLNEFEKFSENLLRGVPKDVSQTVSHRMADSMKGYKSLYAAGHDGVESYATGSGSANNTIAQPIPTPFRKIDENVHKDDSPRSPHAREREFRGVFTPSYLPLLDNTSRERRQSSDSPGRDYKGKEKEMAASSVDASTEVTRSLVTSPETTRPPTPRRKNTDEVSEYSDSGLPRRSALRRSSSGSKGGSPRRVRFDVEGEEVLPTSSPLPSTTILDELAESMPVASGAFDSDDEESGISQIEDVDSPPRPKRISSTQRLRMLSRSAPEEDGVVWTPVSAPLDGSASVPATASPGKFTLGPDDEDDEDEGGSSYKVPRAPTPPRALPHSKHSVDSRDHATEQESTPEDDQMTEMPQLTRSPKTQPTILSPEVPTDISSNKSPTSSTRPSGFTLSTPVTRAPLSPSHGDLDDDDQEVFSFEEYAPNRAAPPTSTKSPEIEVNSDSEEEFLSISPSKSRHMLIELSSSAPRAIPTPPPPKENFPGSLKDVASKDKDFVGSVHPFNMPVVSAVVQRMAESAGDVQTWVGSVDGRSGAWVGSVDGKSGSLRGNGMGMGSGRKGISVGSWTQGFVGEGGEPKSLSERMMMDEERESREMNLPPPGRCGKR